MPKITELYAYVIADADEDDEGVPAFLGPESMYYPLMGADMSRAVALREMAQRMANTAGKPIKLMRSTGLELVETIEPE